MAKKKSIRAVNPRAKNIPQRIANPNYVELVVMPFIDTLERGLPLKFALKLAGISDVQFRSWMKKADKDLEEGKETVYTKIKKRIERAQAEKVLSYINKIELQAEEGEWKAAAWLLERLYPEEFGKKSHQDVNFKGELGIKRIATFQEVYEKPPEMSSLPEGEEEFEEPEESEESEGEWE